MKVQRQRRLLSVLAIACIVSASACGASGHDTRGGAEDEGSEARTTDSTSDASSSPAATENFEVAAAIGEDMNRLDTQAATSPLNRYTTFRNVGESLTTTGADGKLAPLLAETWESVHNMTWRFHLRSGVTFSNGNPMNAASVKFSIERIISEEFGAIHRSSFSSIVGAEVVDDMTVDILTSRADPDLPLKLTTAMIVDPDHTVDFSPDGPNEQHPIGTGAYLFESRTTDSVVLVKSPEYWGGTVLGPQTVTIMARPEASSRVSALLAGEVDLVDQVPLQSADQMPNLVSGAPVQMISLHMNLQSGITQDLRVRQAIAMAIDRESIRDALFGEFAVGGGQCQLGVEGVVGFDADLAGPTYDPEAARMLLEEAGAVGGKIRFAAPVGVISAGAEAAEIAAEQLKEIGLDVELMIRDLTTWRSLVTAPPAGRVEMFMTTGTFDLNTIAQPIGPYLSPEGSFSSIRYEDYPGLEEKYNTAMSEMDPDAREPLLQDLGAEYCQIVPNIALWSAVPLFGTSDRIDVPQRHDHNLLWADIRLSS